MAIAAVDTALRRDERGRVIGEDGLPVCGMATVAEVCSLTGLNRSTIYQMASSGELEVRRFGRAVRIPWEVVRARFAR